VNALADGVLLDRFVVNRDQAAFAALVDRHGPMVLGVCRRVLGRAHDAEDAFQAAFLVLARKAPSIRKRDALASWLHGVAYHVAANLRRAESRRGALQIPRPDVTQEDVVAEVSWREVWAAIDEELALLPQRYRAPLVLCYLEGRTRDEAALSLGWSEGTFRGRLERGRDALRARLIRRGIGLSAVLLASALGHEAATAAPFALVVATVAAATQFTAKGAVAGLISAKVASLTEGVLKAMLVSKLKMAAVVLLALCMAAVGGVMLAKGPDDKQSDKTIKPPVHAASENPAPPAAAPAALGTMRVVVLDPQGKPLPAANIYANISSSISTGEYKIVNQDLKTDAAGAIQVELPKNTTCVRMWAGAKPFVTMFANWEETELASGKGLPADYTFRLERGLTAGGRIVDEDGKPVVGAKVQVNLAGEPKPLNGDGRTRYDNSMAYGSDAAITDAEGHWRIDNVPNSPRAELMLLVSHPDYASDKSWQEASGVNTALLLKEKATLTLKRGVILRGQVTDPAGKPIKDAIIVLGNEPYNSAAPTEFSTDADGRYRLPALAPGETTLTVVTHGWAPQLRKVNVQTSLLPQDFRMALGKTIRLRFVDAAGKPAPKAYVTLNGWKGGHSLQSIFNPNHPKVPNPKIPGKADADGVYEWTWAPDDPVKLIITSEGFARAELEIAGGALERTVTLKIDHVAGRVTDAATGELIPAFTVIPVVVFSKDFLSAERGRAKAGQDGRLSFAGHRTDYPLRIRIEAMGYRTQDGQAFQLGDETARKQDFRLQPSAPVGGVVTDAAGKAVANAEVLLATPTEQGELMQDGDNHKLTTDAAGRFAFPDPGEACAVVVRSDVGIAQAEFPANQHDLGTLRLQPWASIRGQFRDGGQPVRGATIMVDPIRLDAPNQPKMRTRLYTVTDAEGRFEFPQTPPGAVCLWVSLGPWKDEGFRSGPRVPLELKPGRRVELDLGNGGAVVTGKVVLTGKIPPGLDCTYSINYLVPRERGVTPPPEIAALGFDARNGWRGAWIKTTEGLAYLSTLPHWFVKLAPDGTFRISGVPAGEYDLAVEIYAKPSGCLVDPLARKVVRVTVTAADTAKGELALPEIAAPVKPVPAIGDAPALAFRRADGTAGALADSNGHYTVVHFWASWCGPCKKQLPALRRLQERFAAKGVAFLSLSLDDDFKTWQAALKNHDLPWPQGRLDAVEDAGVSSVPEYWLLDADGKIVSKVYDADELTATIAERLK